MIELDPGIIAHKSTVPGAWWTIHESSSLPNSADIPFPNDSTYISLATDEMYRLINGQHLQSTRLYRMEPDTRVMLSDTGYVWGFVCVEGSLTASVKDVASNDWRVIMKHMGMVISGAVSVDLHSHLGASVVVSTSHYSSESA